MPFKGIERSKKRSDEKADETINELKDLGPKLEKRGKEITKFLKTLGLDDDYLNNFNKGFDIENPNEYAISFIRLSVTEGFAYGGDFGYADPKRLPISEIKYAFCLIPPYSIYNTYDTSSSECIVVALDTKNQPIIAGKYININKEFISLEDYIFNNDAEIHSLEFEKIEYINLIGDNDYQFKYENNWSVVEESKTINEYGSLYSSFLNMEVIQLDLAILELLNENRGNTQSSLYFNAIAKDLEEIQNIKKNGCLEEACAKKLLLTSKIFIDCISNPKNSPIPLADIEK